MEENNPVSSSSVMMLKKRLGLFIVIFSFALYAQSISFKYALDDFQVMTGNNLVKKGFSAIPILFKTDRLFGLSNVSERAPEYRPVPMVLLAIEWQLFPDNPHVYHFINVLLYSLVCWLLFILLCKLFEGRKTEENGTPSSVFRLPSSVLFPFICTLLFAAHPIHTEVVDNIKSIDEILCFLFSIFSMLLFLKVAESDKIRILNATFILAIICFFLSLLSKETGIAFLIITPILLFVFTATEFKNILIIAVALIFATGVFLFIRYQIVEAIPVKVSDHSKTPYINSLLAAPDFVSQKATAFYILLRYIFLLVFPYQLSYDYSFAQIPLQQVSSPGALFGIICYLSMGIYATLKIRKKDPVAFALLFYLITLAPVSNIFLLINWTMAERFLFMPSLGFCMLLSFFIIKIADSKLNLRIRRLFNLQSSIFNFHLLPLLLSFIIVSLYSIRTIARNPVWKDSQTLQSHDVNIVPNSAKAHFNYGLILLAVRYPQEKMKESQHSTSKNLLSGAMLDEAIGEFEKTVSIYPDLPEVYYALSEAYFYKEDVRKAIQHMETAVRVSYPIVPTREALYNLASLYSQVGQYDNAITILDSTLKYYPDYLDLYFQKSQTYLRAGKHEDAIVEAEKILKLDTNYIAAYINIGCGYFNLKEYPKAIAYFNRGRQVDSLNTDCLQYLGMTYEMMGDTLVAHKYYEKISAVNSALLNKR